MNNIFKIFQRVLLIGMAIVGFLRFFGAVGKFAKFSGSPTFQDYLTVGLVGFIVLIFVTWQLVQIYRDLINRNDLQGTLDEKHGNNTQGNITKTQSDIPILTEVVATVADNSSSSVEVKLEKLSLLYAKGLISKQLFEERQREIIRDL